MYCDFKQQNELGFITQIRKFGKLLDLGFIVNPIVAQLMNPMKSPPQTKRWWAPTSTLDHHKAKSIGVWVVVFLREIADRG